MAGASLRISTLCLGIVISGLLGASDLRAEEVSEISAYSEIEAKAYNLKTVRPSRSGRVYLFQKYDAEMPVDGKIFLLRAGDTPVMALRVLKTYSTTMQVAAKKLLPYEGFPALAPNSEYRAYEKIGNKVAPVPPTPEDLKDLAELETPPELPPDSPAPAVPSPQVEVPPEVDPELKQQQEEEEVEDEVGSHYPNFFTMAVGLLFNAKVPGPDPKFGGGLLYSRNLGPTWAIEGGFFYYKASGDINDTTISTTILPLIGSIRYQHRYNDLWTLYAYGGLIYPYVASEVGATKRQLSEIQTLSPTLGVGAFLQTGPNWYLRVNLGTDALMLGVTLQY